MWDILVSCVCIHRHSCASVKTFIYDHVNVILTGKYSALMSCVLCPYRTYVPSNGKEETERYGNGLFCSVQVGINWCFFLLTCCHIFLKKEEKRTKMTVEDFIAAMLRCKEAKYVVWGKVRAKLPANNVLGDFENPVIYFDKVSGWRVQLY